MSPVDLRLAATHVGRNEIIAALEKTESLPSEKLDLSADLEPIGKWLATYTDEASSVTASTDATVAPLLHECLHHLPRRLLLDPRFWTWLSVEALRDYCVARWIPDPSHIAATADSVLRRFTATSSMVGLSRNACARLYWAADASHTYLGNYSAVPSIFKKADLFVQIFEREFGLSSMAVVVLSTELCNGSETHWRKVTKGLNHILTTTSLELLSESQFKELVQNLEL